MSEDIFLSVIIPAYNEEPNIAKTLREVNEYLIAKNFSYEVIVVNDGSSDGTSSEADGSKDKLSNFRLIESFPNKGKGYVVRKAIMMSRGKFVMFMDADNSTSIYELDKFLPYLKEGYDVVMGSRRLKDSKIDVPEPIMRIVLGNFYIFLSKIFFGINVSDFNCGFKSYKSDSAKRLFSLQTMDNWSFDTEVIFLIKKLRMKIKEVPVRWTHKNTSKVKPIQAGIDSFLSLLRIKFRELNGTYKV